MERGTIIRLIREKGFGFVTTQRGREVFVHATAFRPGVFDNLREGQEVAFDIDVDPHARAERAVNVEPLD